MIFTLMPRFPREWAQTRRRRDQALRSVRNVALSAVSSNQRQSNIHDPFFGAEVPARLCANPSPTGSSLTFCPKRRPCGGDQRCCAVGRVVRPDVPIRAPRQKTRRWLLCCYWIASRPMGVVYRFQRNSALPARPPRGACAPELV